MATLPSNTPSRWARATLQRFCAALERRSDAAAAHRAHQSQTAPPKRFFPSRRINAVASYNRLVVLHAAHAVIKSPLNAFHQTPKTPSCSHRISRVALTSIARHTSCFICTSHVTTATAFAILNRIALKYKYLKGRTQCASSPPRFRDVFSTRCFCGGRRRRRRR